MVIIHKATRAYMHEIEQVYFQAWKETYQGVFSNQYLNSLNPEQFAKMADKCIDNTYIAILHDKVIGFASYCESNDNKLGATGEITALYILKEYQGLGIGRYLIQHCFNDLFNYKNILLWTSSNNIKSIEFYHHFGFIEDGNKKDLSLEQGKKLPLMRMRRKLNYAHTH